MTKKNESKVFEERKKELFLSLLKKDDVSSLLKVLEEGGSKGAENFQRMKLKGLLSSKNTPRGKKFSAWEYLKKTITIPGMKDEDRENIVEFLKSKTGEVPSFVRYMTLMNESEEFFNENFETFVENVKNEKDFMAGILIKRSEEEVMAAFFESFNKEDDSLKESVLDMVKLSATFGKELMDLKERLNGINLEEYGSLESELIDEGYPSALVLFVFLVVGTYPQELNKPIYYLSMERFARYLVSGKLDDYLKPKAEEEGTSTNTKNNGAKNQLKRVTQEKKRLEEELSELKELIKKEKEEMTEKVEALQKQNKELVINEATQKKQIETYERQMGGYTMNLSNDLTELKIVVGHSSPLLYAPLIFPDLKFLNVQELINGVQKKTTDLIILQKNGLSFTDYRKVTQALKEKNIEWLEIDATEERSVIMKVSVIIQNLLTKE